MLLFQGEELIEKGGISATEWIVAGVIFAVAIVVAIVVQRIATRIVDRSDSDHHAALLIGRFLAYLIILGGLVYALSTLGVRIGPLLGALGIGGIALAFALQETIENLFAGIFLQVRRPFKRGEQIITGDHEGTVEDVNLRAVIIRTVDGDRVHIPNAAVLKAPIINHTALQGRRTTLVVGVAYDTDLKEAEKVLVNAVRDVDEVRVGRGPEAFVEEFADSSINFAVRFWHAPDIATMWRTRHKVALAVKSALDGAGIEIPFPQRTLWWGDGSPGGLGVSDRPAGDRDA